MSAAAMPIAAPPRLTWSGMIQWSRSVKVAMTSKPVKTQDSTIVGV
ncbi:MAG: hypothetical protein BWZ10_02172 [candidate division BRC1 bacterium ADurb.BinA364]|nr:MAG: hypothetical protein BWZ10_02172 [candidate division BRC1 bacterium ADurb.BinA364]